MPPMAKPIVALCAIASANLADRQQTAADADDGQKQQKADDQRKRPGEGDDERSDGGWIDGDIIRRAEGAAGA